MEMDPLLDRLSTPDDVAGPSRRVSLKLILALLAMSPFLLLSIVILAVYFWSFRASEELDRLRESIRDDGYPITVEELSEWYSPGPGSELSGLALVELIYSYDFELDDNEELLIFNVQPDIQEPLTDAEVQLASKHLQNNSEYLGDLHRFLDEYEAVRYPVDVTEGFNADMAYLALVRKMTRMMALEALLAANTGYAAKTTDALIGAFRAAETLQYEPTVLSHLVRVACLNIAFDASEQAIHRIDLTAADLELLRGTVDAIDCNGITQFGMVGERCFVNWAVKKFGITTLTGEDIPTAERHLLMKLPSLGRYMDWEELHAIEAFTELMSVGNVEPFQRRELFQRIEGRLQDTQVLGSHIAKLLVPALVRAYGAENRILAYLDALSVGLAALQFSYDHERMPIDLQELVPEYISEVPTDPFSGEPLRMRSDETGFVVYSLGHDRDDDGGYPPPEGETIMDDGDIVFRILR